MRARHALSALLAACVVTLACGDDQVREQRKELLRPDEILRKQSEERERLRIFDDQGELIPSGEEIADLELPKGLHQFRELEREHYFDAPRITIDKLERYFGSRLLPMGVEYTNTSVTFQDAHVKGADPTALLVTVRIGQVTGTDPASELLIRIAKPPHKLKTREETEKELAEARKYAD